MMTTRSTVVERGAQEKIILTMQVLIVCTVLEYSAILEYYC
jgi:hypothetical protein